MGRTKKVIDYKELIQQHMDKTPFEPFKHKRQDVIKWAEMVAVDINKQFGKTHKCVMEIGPETSSPPNQVSWKVTELEAK